MWVRKSKVQIAKERDREWRSLRGPAMYFLIGFILTLSSLYNKRIGGILPPRYWPRLLVLACVVAVLAASIAYGLQRLLRTKVVPSISDFDPSVPRKADTVICDRCHGVKQRDGELACQCGGQFDDFDNWTWIDDNGSKMP